MSKLNLETIAAIQATLGQERLTAKQVASRVNLPWHAVASSLRGMHGRGEVRRTVGRAGFEPVWWVK